MTKYQSASKLAEAGFYVFRLKPNAKTPARAGWQEEATRDQTLIKSYFDNNNDYNIGISGEKFDIEDRVGLVLKTSPLAIVDVDTKEGKRGNETMAALDAMGYDFPPTVTQTTASGGRHIIYTTPTALAGGANKLGPHVDLISAGRYIVGAGSTINNSHYTMDYGSSAAPTQAPDWLPKRCPPPIPKSALASIVSNDSEQAISRATTLANQTEATSGGRNDQAFKLGAQIRDLGVSQVMTEEILHGWNATKVYPPLDPEEITTVTNSVFHYAKLSMGNKSPQADFQAVPFDPKIDDLPIKDIDYILPRQITDDTESSPLIEDFLDQDALSLVYGPSNMYKTFVALSMAYHVATGTEWNGRHVEKGAVVYLAAEGGRSAKNRIRALKYHHNIEDFPLALIPHQLNLFDSAKDRKTFITLVEKAEKELGPVRLIIIDTLSRAIAGGNENDSADMGKFIESVTFIKEHCKAHTMLIHHSGKDVSKGARGHSLIRAAVDTELEINEGTILTRKQRDMEFAKPVGFVPQIVHLGVNKRGKEITSCVVNYHDISAQENFKLEPRDTICLMSLTSIKNDRKVANFANVVTGETWRQVCKDFKVETVSGAKPWPKSDKSFAKAFERSRDRLEGFGMVEEVEDNQWVIVL